MSHTDEFRIVGKLQKLLLAIFAGQIDPANDSANKVILFGKLQCPTILCDIVLGLHKNRVVDSTGFDQWTQVLRQETSADFF